MRYLTDRKRAVGRGAAHHGTEHHWFMSASGIGLAFIMPVWVYVIGSAIGDSHEEVIATFSRPFPAILTGLVLFVAMRHFDRGAQMAIEDYFGGWKRRALILFFRSISYAVIATGLYALARIAL